MTTRIWTAACAAIVGVATIGITAQTPQQQQPPPTPTPQTAPAPQSVAPAPGDITVTGCLKEAPATAPDPASPVGTSGTTATTTAGAAAPGPQYVLSEATMSAPQPASADAPPPAAAPASGSPQTYRLLANAAALTPHVGKKLEIVGTLESKDAAAATPTGDASSLALRVKSGRIVAASCTP
jgi:hypothetical protein